jgi:hypothetical protein
MSEISGILKNGIDRGWQIMEIKRSLLSAGYSSQEIESEMSAFQAKPITMPEPLQPDQKNMGQNLKNYQTLSVESKKSPAVLLYVLILLSVLGIAGIAFYFLKF